jgi:tryptophan synthase alpha subunit
MSANGGRLSVEATIAARKAAGSGALIGYLPVGFPDLQTSIDAAVAIVENGVDILELGLPYSDPVMVWSSRRQLKRRWLTASNFATALRR